MFSLRRPFAGALSHSSPLRVGQSLPARLSSTMSVAAATSQEYEALTIPPIFDIFDAPVRLGESSTCVGRRSTTTRMVVLECDGEISRNTANDFTKARYISSLPPPIIFNGPARPAHLLRGALEDRRKMRQTLPLSHNRHACPPSSSLTPPSEIACEMFDGPSRITRYKYPVSSSKSSSRAYVCLALAISGAFGWLAFKDQLETQQWSEIRAFPYAGTKNLALGIFSGYVDHFQA